MTDRVLTRWLKGALGIAALGLMGAVVLRGHGGDPAKIHSCVKADGTIRIIAAGGVCKNSESALDWNIAGAPGVPGPAGPSDAYRAYGAPGNLPDNSINTGPIDFATVTVPAGDYVVLATAQAQDASTGFQNTSLQCLIKANGVDQGYMYSTFAGESALLRMTVPLSVTATGASTEVTLSCGTAKGASTTGAANSAEGGIHAIRVGELHNQ